MALNESYLNYIIDQLSEFGEIDVKRMFGGAGLFKDGLMFGMIGDDTFRLKVDKHNQPDYEAHGMRPYHSKNKKRGMPYWEVPTDVLEDKSLLSEWAWESYKAALRT